MTETETITSYKQLIYKLNSESLFYKLCKSNHKLEFFDERDAKIFISAYDTNFKENFLSIISTGAVIFGISRIAKPKTALISAGLLLGLNYYWINLSNKGEKETMKNIESKYPGWQNSPKLFNYLTGSINN